MVTWYGCNNVMVTKYGCHGVEKGKGYDFLYLYPDINVT
jgi:hypothetical protein